MNTQGQEKLNNMTGRESKRTREKKTTVERHMERGTLEDMNLLRKKTFSLDRRKIGSHVTVKHSELF